MIDEVIILAAGLGTRMQNQAPKPLVKICGKSLLELSCECVRDVPNKIFVVADGMMHGVALNVVGDVRFVTQFERKGTGHAVLVGSALLKGDSDIIAVTYADTPFVSQETMHKAASLVRSGVADLVVIAFQTSVKNTYGRIEVLDTQTDERLPTSTTPDQSVLFVSKIEEASVVADKTNLIDDRLCNSGIMVMKKDLLVECLAKMTPKGDKEELQLTELVELCLACGWRPACVVTQELEAMGINTPAELNAATQALQQKLRTKHLSNGVKMIDPNSVYFSYDTLIGRDTEIMPCVNFGMGVNIGTSCFVGSFSSLSECVVGDCCRVGPNVVLENQVELKNSVTVKEFSSLNNCVVGPDSCVGPFARIRPETVVENNVKIGNFVELKKSTIGTGSKISHLSYVGNSTLGKRVLLGAGTITCNYDGFDRHETKIDDDAFVGSGTLMVAPRKIGKGALIGAGSLLKSNVNDGELFIPIADSSKIAGGATRFRNKKSALSKSGQNKST